MREDQFSSATLQCADFVAGFPDFKAEGRDIVDVAPHIHGPSADSEKQGEYNVGGSPEIVCDTLEIHDVRVEIDQPVPNTNVAGQECVDGGSENSGVAPQREILAERREDPGSKHVPREGTCI